MVVADDCSTDRASIDAFGALEQKHATKGWRFVRTERNSGPGATRNLAARHAETELILFVDADNLPRPTMVEKLVGAMDLPRRDVVVCSLMGFSETDASGRPKRALWTYTPHSLFLPVAAISHNTLGDTNFCIRKEAFERLGGFREDRDLQGVEDWDLLLRLELAGLSRGVVEEVLVDYRVQPGSMSRRSDTRRKYERLLDTFLAGSPAHVQALVRQDWLDWHLKRQSRSYRVAHYFVGVFKGECLIPRWLSRLARGERAPQLIPRPSPHEISQGFAARNSPPASTPS